MGSVTHEVRDTRESVRQDVRGTKGIVTQKARDTRGNVTHEVRDRSIKMQISWIRIQQGIEFLR